MTARAPRGGGRVLVIVGVAHKPFLDAVLGTLMDCDVVHLENYCTRCDGAARAGDRELRLADAYS